MGQEAPLRMAIGTMIDWRIVQGDCLDVMPSLPDSSVGLILTDPPYYRVKNEPWDKQWDSPAKFIEWFGLLCAEWQRALKPNGSLYVFASPKMAARVECKVAEFFTVLQQIVWNKAGYDYASGDQRATAFRAIDVGRLRQFFEHSERIVFAEQRGANSSSVLGEAIQQARISAGLSTTELAEVTGAYGNVNHGGKVSNWENGTSLPSEEEFCRAMDACGASTNYEDLCTAEGGTSCPTPIGTAIKAARLAVGMNATDIDIALGYVRTKNPARGTELCRRWEEGSSIPSMGDFQRAMTVCGKSGDYARLRAEYESLRRPFSVTADVPYTDVWDFPTVKPYAGKHPCEKPLAMLEHIVTASSREGDTVLDCFCGSGATGEAAVKHGREFIGIELSGHWCQRSEERIGEVENPKQLSLAATAQPFGSTE